MRPGSKRRGGAFLITLGVLAGLVAILATTAATQHVGLLAIQNRMQARRARLMAEAGLQRCLASLANQNQNQAVQQDEWYTLGQTGDEEFTVGADSFRIQVIDAGSLVNLNSAPEDQLARLPLTQEQIDSLLDWREASMTPRADGGKDEYYNQLATPYNAKLQPLTSLDELLLIKGFTAKSLFEPQTDVVSTQPLPQKADGTDQTLYDLCTVDSTSGNVDANGQQKPNIATATLQALSRYVPPPLAQQILARRPTTYATLLGIAGITPQQARALVNAFGTSNGATVTGKINLNTATEAVLETLPNVTPDLANAIVSRQSTGFNELGDLFDVPGFSVQAARTSLDSFTTNSRTFIVRSVGTAGQTTVSLEAVVSLSATGVQVVKENHLPEQNMASRWGWNPDAGSQTVLVEASRP